MNYRKNFFATGLFVCAMICLCQSTIAQQDKRIVVVNQDGEELDAERLKNQLQADQEDSKPTNIVINNGKIKIVNEDGTTREFDVTGAQSLMINKSIESIVEDGQEKKRVRGKAIVIGPDGERQEFEIGDGGLGEFKIPMRPFGDLKNAIPKWALRRELNMGWNGGKYMVGLTANRLAKRWLRNLACPKM